MEWHEVQHYSIDNFIHGTWIISQSCTHTQNLCKIGKSKKHFVYDFGAKPQHEEDRKDYEEGGGEFILVKGNLLALLINVMCRP